MRARRALARSPLARTEKPAPPNSRPERPEHLAEDLRCLAWTKEPLARCACCACFAFRAQEVVEVKDDFDISKDQYVDKLKAQGVANIK